MARRKKTHEEFVAELSAINPEVEVLGEYTGANTKLEVRCKKDGHVWSPTPAVLLCGKGCPKCAGNIKKTREQFVSELATINPNVEVLGEYISALTKLKVKCKIDGHEWEVQPSKLLIGRGCPKCYHKNSLKSGVDFIKQVLLLNPNIEVLERYKGSCEQILVRCKTAGHEWFARAASLLRGHGCPKCSGVKRKTHKEFIAELSTSNPNVEVLGVYTNNATKIKVRCKKDGYVWSPTPNSLLCGSGCPKCSDKRKTHEQFVFELRVINPNVEVVSKYSSSNAKINLYCKIDGHGWSATPKNLLKGQGCPKCARYGYNLSKVGYFYVYAFQNYLGFGVTNTPRSRNSRHKTTFKKLNIEAQLIQTFSGDGLYIQQLEAHLKQTLPIVNTGVEGFKTEAILYSDRELLYKAIEEFHSRHNSPLKDSLQASSQSPKPLSKP